MNSTAYWFILLPFIYGAGSLLFMLLWNASFRQIFALAEMTYQQALAMVLCITVAVKLATWPWF